MQVGEYCFFYASSKHNRRRITAPNLTLVSFFFPNLGKVKYIFHFHHCFSPIKVSCFLSSDLGLSVGQNYALSSGHNTPWKDVVDAWYNEINDFVFGEASTDGKPVGHYTQVKCIMILFLTKCLFYKALKSILRIVLHCDVLCLLHRIHYCKFLSRSNQ